MYHFSHLNSLPNNRILDSSKLKAFADDKINVTKELKLILERENILWESFLFSHHEFKRLISH